MPPAGTDVAAAGRGRDGRPVGTEHQAPATQTKIEVGNRVGIVAACELDGVATTRQGDVAVGHGDMDHRATASRLNGSLKLPVPIMAS